VRLFLIAALMLSGVALLPPAGTSPPPVPPPAQASGAAVPDGWNSIAIAGDRQGQYVVDAVVNGTPVDFLVDTGATHVVLAPGDAARIGLRPGQLRFTGTAATANGTVRLAPVTLRELRIGQLSRQAVAAVVNEAPMGISLLGMSFLEGLEGWEARGDRLLLYW
jgi:aspartyl protease family protein